MKPFDFQEELISQNYQALRRDRHVVCQASTGYGKGVVIAETTRRAILKGSVVCIVCHREEIYRQLVVNLQKMGIFPAMIVPGNHPMPGSQVYLGMVETICRRMTKGLIERLKINFWQMDEIHYGSYYKLVKAIDNNFIIGYTATPKTTGKPNLKEYFGEMTQGIPISELIRIGRLVKAKTFATAHDFSKVKKKGKEFDDRELYKEFKKPVLRDGAVLAYLEHAKGLPALCYCVNVEHSNETTLQFRKHGIRAAHLDGNSNSETRQAIWRMYLDGELDVVCNVGIATTGTDFPHTRCIISNFATLSIVKDIQVKGRGGRCDDGKDHFVHIDMGMNYWRFGEFGEEIDWKFIFNHPDTELPKKKQGKRRCDDCGGVIKISLSTCPYCGAMATKKEIEEKMMLGSTIEEIREYKLKTLPPHLRMPVSQMAYPQLLEYSQHMHYDPRWVYIQLNARKKKQ